MSIYKEFRVDFRKTRYAGPTAAEMKMAAEIAKLRDREFVLLEALRLLTTLAPGVTVDTSDPMGMAIKTAAAVRAAQAEELRRVCREMREVKP